MNPKLERREFVAPLIGLVSKAIDHGLLDDAAAVLAGVRVLRPRLLELDILEGWILIKREQYRECVQLMRNLESSPTQWSLAKAMMASCQQFLNDSEWEISVNDVLQGDASADAIEMVEDVKKRATKKHDGSQKEDAKAQGTEDESAADASTATAPPLPTSYDMSFMFHLRA
jgi:type III secretion protein HrpB1